MSNAFLVVLLYVIYYKYDLLLLKDIKMSIEKVRNYFMQFKMDGKIKEFEVSSATVELAAKALNCEPCKIAKTMSFKMAEKPILIVTAGDVKVDNSKYKSTFGTKAKMLGFVNKICRLNIFAQIC